MRLLLLNVIKCLVSSLLILQIYISIFSLDLDEYLRDASAVLPNEKIPDGKFNSYSIYYKEIQKSKAPFKSYSHCVGNNFNTNSDWIHQSCLFKQLCFDTQNKIFNLFIPQHELSQDHNIYKRNPLLYSSSSLVHNVSLGGIVHAWPSHEASTLKWFPKVLSIENFVELNKGYYSFDNDSVFIPFHSFAGYNPGHLVWDDFLPIYTLLEIFNLVQHNIVPIRIELSKTLWASCPRQLERCEKMFEKFLPLLGLTINKISTQNDPAIRYFSKEGAKSKYICAPQAVAGVSVLNDHGLTNHGWLKTDFERSHNHGRGPSLYRFRNWMIRNIKLDPHDGEYSLHEPPYNILISIGSSNSKDRSSNFTDEIIILQNHIDKKKFDINITSVNLSKKSVQEQIKIISKASILISACGGGAVSSIFLPRGASLILYFSSNIRKNRPAYLDFDVLNNLGYIRVHWIPFSAKYYNHNEVAVNVSDTALSLSTIVTRELEIISQLRKL